MKKKMSLVILVLGFITQPIQAKKPAECQKINVKSDGSVTCISPKGANIPDGIYHTDKGRRINIVNGKVPHCTTPDIGNHNTSRSNRDSRRK